MTNDKLAALDKAAKQSADDIAYYSGGSKHNEPLEQLKTTLVNAYRAGELVPVSLDAVTAGLVARLRWYCDACGGPDDPCSVCKAATALRTITAERDALAKRVSELEARVASSIPWAGGQSPITCGKAVGVSATRPTLKGTGDHG